MEVCSLRDVEVAIHAVLECTVVHPDVLGAICRRDEVAATDIDRARTDERNVADDDVLATAEGKDSRIAVTLVVVASKLHDNLSRVVFCLFSYILTIGKCTATTAGTHTRYAGGIQSIFDLLSHVPLGADAGIVNTDDGLVGCGDTHVARYDEVAFGAVKDDHFVIAVLDGILYRALHVGTVGLQDNRISFETFRNRIGVAAATRNVIGGVGSTRRLGTETKGLVQVVL